MMLSASALLRAAPPSDRRGCKVLLIWPPFFSQLHDDESWAAIFAVRLGATVLAAYVDEVGGGVGVGGAENTAKSSGRDRLSGDPCERSTRPPAWHGGDGLEAAAS